MLRTKHFTTKFEMATFLTTNVPKMKKYVNRFFNCCINSDLNSDLNRHVINNILIVLKTVCSRQTQIAGFWTAPHVELGPVHHAHGMEQQVRYC